MMLHERMSQTVNDRLGTKPSSPAHLSNGGFCQQPTPSLCSIGIAEWPKLGRRRSVSFRLDTLAKQS